MGHTGDLKAVVRACTTVDRHLGDLLEAVEKQGGRWLVSSDHGNADDMVQVHWTTYVSSSALPTTHQSCFGGIQYCLWHMTRGAPLAWEGCHSH